MQAFGRRLVRMIRHRWAGLWRVIPVVARLPDSNGYDGYGCRVFVTRDDSLRVCNAGQTTLDGLVLDG